MSIKKQYLKTKPVCKVTFQLPENVLQNGGKIQLLGDFNNWDMSSEPMKKKKNGEYYATFDLETGKEYQYRYLIDGVKWDNDPDAEKYVPNEFYTDNSVVTV